MSRHGLAHAFARVAAAAALLVAVSVASGTGALAAGQELGKVLPTRSPEKVYSSTCGYCHGHNVGPIIRGRGLPVETIEYFVRHGNGAMPAFRPTEISNTELKALAQWISQAPVDAKEHGQ